MNLTKIATIVCAGVLAVCMLAGCSTTTQSNLTDEQKANREYMASVNQKMSSLDEVVSSFNDAVSREDVVTMKTQATNVAKSLEELEAIQAPDGFTDIHADYVDGAKSLEAALNEYIDLYSEIDAATDSSPFDWSSYDQRIAAIQSHYEEGVASLKAADQVVSEKS